MIEIIYELRRNDFEDFKKLDSTYRRTDEHSFNTLENRMGTCCL